MKLLFTLLLVFSAEAHNKVGNGGNAVVCKTRKPKKITARLLDFYEQDLSPAAEGSDPFAIADKKLESLEAIAPSLGALYRKRVKEMAGEMELKAGVKLSAIDDSNHLFQPAGRGCSVEQLAIRRKDANAGEKRFLINKDLWDKMNPAGQAGLLAHEVIYEHFSKLGESDSIKARKINSLIFSDKLSGEKFWAAIKEMRIPIYP